ncbi:MULTISPECIES: F-box-like domain-containing protein [Parachlamydia]|jgi:hypothetical protein|uniref:F-box domain-containing protein n=2 Tax=Parachlamydia acanthamoebae TaxID=83552 RepID=F8KZN4_PARAV|nr:F-box-like domain-containing protein [Parachlamydia acanthamoebae]EFB41736.1 hypothetical protein pah_c022o001 [Parachlamydia acanthamoebae str. Hall's coccus]KIA77886.1 hypothetical protein DB43_FL00010 [Parachlamydia acanthamoebae]CCB86381.1 putative uncharacterized protein [Parachlamydia acanthamoebae UV-7]
MISDIHTQQETQKKFLELPSKLQLFIFSYCDLKTLALLAGTCQTLQAIASDQSLKIQAFAKRFYIFEKDVKRRLLTHREITVWHPSLIVKKAHIGEWEKACQYLMDHGQNSIIIQKIENELAKLKNLCTYSSGICEGTFNESKGGLNGRGTIFYADGDIWRGQFLHGKLIEGYKTSSDNEICEGKFCNDSLIEGKIIGHTYIMQGKFENDELVSGEVSFRKKTKDEELID